MRHAKAMEWETAALRTGWQRRACPRGGLRRSIHDTAQYTMSMPTLGGPSGSSLLLRTSNTVCCGAMSLLCEVVSKREICTLQGVATRLVLKRIALCGPAGHRAPRGRGKHARHGRRALRVAFALRPFPPSPFPLPSSVAFSFSRCRGSWISGGEKQGGVVWPISNKLPLHLLGPYG